MNKIRKSIAILAVIVAAAAAAPSAARASNQAAVEQATKAADSWLKLIDQRKYGQSWEGAAPIFRGGFMDLIAPPNNPIPLGVSAGFLQGEGRAQLGFGRLPNALRARRGPPWHVPARSGLIVNNFQVGGRAARPPAGRGTALVRPESLSPAAGGEVTIF